MRSPPADRQCIGVWHEANRQSLTPKSAYFFRLGRTRRKHPPAKFDVGWSYEDTSTAYDADSLPGGSPKGFLRR
jgi:hypothetical protein